MYEILNSYSNFKSIIISIPSTRSKSTFKYCMKFFKYFECVFSFLDIKKAYVDVFNPAGTTAAKSAVPAPEVFGAVPSGGAQMNFFVPQPIADPNAPTDFLTPPTGGTEENSQVRTSV